MTAEAPTHPLVPGTMMTFGRWTMLVVSPGRGGADGHPPEVLSNACRLITRSVRSTAIEADCTVDLHLWRAVGSTGPGGGDRP